MLDERIKRAFLDSVSDPDKKHMTRDDFHVFAHDVERVSGFRFGPRIVDRIFASSCSQPHRGMMTFRGYAVAFTSLACIVTPHVAVDEAVSVLLGLKDARVNKVSSEVGAAREETTLSGWPSMSEECRASPDPISLRSAEKHSIGDRIDYEARMVCEILRRRMEQDYETVQNALEEFGRCATSRCEVTREEFSSACVCLNLKGDMSFIFDYLDRDRDGFVRAEDILACSNEMRHGS